MAKEPQPVTQKDLPITLNNIKIVKRATYQEYAGNTLLAIGGIITLAGILILIFGPSSLKVSLSGPTFTEFLLLNPGPIASIGFFLIFAGSQVASHALDPVQKFVEENYALHDEYDKPAENAIIAASPSSNGTLTLHYVPIEKEQPNPSE